MTNTDYATAPFGAAGETARCACFGLRKAARAVTLAYDAALEPAGLKATQFSLLAVLATLGAPTLGDLARVMVMERTTLTRNLRPLTRAGAVALTTGRDRRARHVALTAAGRQRLEAALPLWRRAQLDMVERLGPRLWGRLPGDLAAAAEAGMGRRSG